jgi:peptide/nickel transport system permease protein
MTQDSQAATGSLMRERLDVQKRRLKEFWNLYTESRIGMLGFLIIITFIITAVIAPLITPYDPRALVGTPFLPPARGHLLGTDQVGRDIYSQLIWGSRVSLMLILAALLGRSMWNIIFVIAVTGWTGTAKMVRSQTLSIKERPYVEAARSVGAKDKQIIIRHILPNVFPLIFANAIVGIVDSILAESGLSFLGLGDPTKPSWGQLLRYASEAGALATGRWWFIIPPGLCIMLISIGFAFSSYSLDHILNPRLRERRG